MPENVGPTKNEPDEKITGIGANEEQEEAQETLALALLVYSDAFGDTIANAWQAIPELTSLYSSLWKKVHTDHPDGELTYSELCSLVWQDETLRTMWKQAMKLVATDESFRASMRELWKDPTYRAKQAEARRKKWEDPEYREKIEPSFVALRKRWEDPEFRKRRSQQTTEESLRRWSDPEFREQTIAKMKLAITEPGVRERQREALRQRWEDPESRKKRMARIKQLWADPEFREKMRVARQHGRAAKHEAKLIHQQESQENQNSQELNDR